MSRKTDISVMNLSVFCPVVRLRRRPSLPIPLQILRTNGNRQCVFLNPTERGAGFMGRVIRLAMCWLVLASFGVAYGQAALKAGVELEGFTPARTRTVSTLSDLQAALADARPSDLIEVTAGEYVTEEPIIVRGLTG